MCQTNWKDQSFLHKDMRHSLQAAKQQNWVTNKGILETTLRD
jgi:hypothetical protein